MITRPSAWRLITKSERYTNPDVERMIPRDRPLAFRQFERGEGAASRPRVSVKVMWNIAISVAAVSYLLMTLCLNVESPLFAGLLIVAAGHEIFESKLGRREHRE